MNKHLVVDLQGRKLGELSSGKVMNERGETVFRLSGNSLSDVKSGKAYMVTPDGRVIDQYKGQFGFVYNYPLYRNNQASYSSNSTENERGKAVKTESAGKTASGNSGKRLVILLIILVAVYMVYHSTTGIVGTWVIKSVSIDGRMYSYDEAQKLFNQYPVVEYHFNKDGTVAVKADGCSAEGRWYERWKNNYEAYFGGVSYDITLKNGELTIYDDQRLVTCRRKAF